jgi:hypothetical protein
VTAGLLQEVADKLRIVEESGEDLSEINSFGTTKLLRLINAGKTLPEVVARFGYSPRLFEAICRLPLPEQRKLAEGEKVNLVALEPGGSATRTMVDPCDLRWPNQVKQVFAEDLIRTEAEQIAFLQAAGR